MERVRETFKSYEEYKDFYMNSEGYPLVNDSIIDADIRGIPTLPRWEYGLRWLKQLQCKTVLEVGSWTGRFVTVLRSNDFKVDCIEANTAANDWAGRIAENVMFEESGEKKYDAVVAFEVIEHAYDMDRFLNKVRDHLEPNGYFILSTPAKGGIYDDDNEIHLWIADYDSMMETFKDWTIIDYEADDLIYMVVKND